MIRATDRCPSWNYKEHPRFRSLMITAQEYLLSQLARQNDQLRRHLENPRPVHRILFNQLAPRNHRYYAGNYRGPRYPCLDINVTFGGHVGVSSRLVGDRMEMRRQIIAEELARIEQLGRDETSTAEATQFVYDCCRLAAIAAATVIEVHPFLDGNGHVSRHAALGVLAYFGFSISKWTVDPRPEHNDYVTVMDQAVRGNLDPLVEHLVDLLLDDHTA